MKLNTIIGLVIRKQIRELRIWSKVLLRILIFCASNSLRRAAILDSSIQGSNVARALGDIELSLVLGPLTTLSLLTTAQVVLFSID
jgi:hypothetical protein